MFIFGSNTNNISSSNDLNIVFRSFTSETNSRTCAMNSDEQYDFFDTDYNSENRNYLANNNTEYKYYWIFFKGNNNNGYKHSISNLKLYGHKNEYLFIKNNCDFKQYTTTRTLFNSECLLYYPKTVFHIEIHNQYT